MNRVAGNMISGFSLFSRKAVISSAAEEVRCISIFKTSFLDLSANYGQVEDVFTHNVSV